VLASDGTGTTADLLRAYEWLYYNARSLGIRIVNLSLTGGGGDTDPQCEWTSALARQGITVVAATGNNKANMLNEAPGACAKALAVSNVLWFIASAPLCEGDKALASRPVAKRQIFNLPPSSLLICPILQVTSFTDRDGQAGNDAFSWFSNWLPSAQATDARKRRIVAAPGESIISTYPMDRIPVKNLPQGYHSMSGTSMVRRCLRPRRGPFWEGKRLLFGRLVLGLDLPLKQPQPPQHKPLPLQTTYVNPHHPPNRPPRPPPTSPASSPAATPPASASARTIRRPRRSPR